jgi:hypothetical protein
MKCLVVNNIFLSLWGVVKCPHLSYSAWMHHSALFVLVFTPQAVSVCDLYLHGVYDVVVRCAGATNVFFRIGCLSGSLLVFGIPNKER